MVQGHSHEALQGRKDPLRCAKPKLPAGPSIDRACWDASCSTPAAAVPVEPRTSMQWASRSHPTPAHTPAPLQNAQRRVREHQRGPRKRTREPQPPRSPRRSTAWSIVALHSAPGPAPSRRASGGLSGGSCPSSPSIRPSHRFPASQRRHFRSIPSLSLPGAPSYRRRAFPPTPK